MQIYPILKSDSRPNSVCSGAYINCHLYSVAHTMLRRSNPSKIPARAKISCSHSRVGLKPTIREQYRSCIYRLNTIWTANFQARDFFIFILDQTSSRRILKYLIPNLQRTSFQLPQNGAAAHRFDVYSALKMVFSVDHTLLLSLAKVGLKLSINRHAMSSFA